MRIKEFGSKLFPEKNKTVIAANRKANLPFLVSALAYFCLSLDNKLGYVLGIAMGMGILFAVSGQLPSLWEKVKAHSRKEKLFYGLTSAGICWGAQSYFLRQTQKLMMPRFEMIFWIVSILGAVAAVYFVYIGVAYFWKAFAKSASGVFGDMTRGEKILCGAVMAALTVLVVFAFSRSEAFCGTEHLHTVTNMEFLYDVIYTSDTAALQRENAFFALTHPQNDLRQPLFAVFAAPLLGVGYLLGRLISGSEIVHMTVLNLPQLLLLVAANWMVAKMMDLTPGKRSCFVILSSCMYSNLLFSLMMEQYIVAYFWLAFCAYQICKKGRPDTFVMYGAGGTLLTTMILMPALSEKHPVKQFKGWFADMVKYGLGFIALMLLFARFDIFTSLLMRVKEFTGYADPAQPVEQLNFINKLYQFTEFVKNCFALPAAGASLTFKPYPSWQLHPISALNWVGIGILVLCLISFLWNRKDRSSRVAAFWVVFSGVMLLVLGWGTGENGLILYALYFGWAFLVLLFQLVEKLESTLHIPYFTVICSIAASFGLLLVNIPAILEMIRFAIEYYPA